MKNSLADLNNHLFAQLERLGEEDLTQNAEMLEKEVARTKAVTSVAKEIIANSRTVLEAQKEFGTGKPLPPMLGIDKQ